SRASLCPALSSLVTVSREQTSYRVALRALTLRLRYPRARSSIASRANPTRLPAHALRSESKTTRSLPTTMGQRDSELRTDRTRQTSTATKFADYIASEVFRRCQASPLVHHSAARFHS